MRNNYIIMNKIAIKRFARIALLGFILASGIAVFSTLIYVTTEIADNYFGLSSVDFGMVLYVFFNELTGAINFALLIPLMIIVFRKLPITKENYLRLVPLYLLLSVIFGLTHTGLMFYSRTILSPLLGFGKYDYGYIPVRIVMEYLKQLALMGTTYTIYMLITARREREKQRLRFIQLEEQLTKARLEALKMQLNPHFLFNTLNMISSVMYEDIDTADKMIANLSDLLRQTLQSPSNGLISIKQEKDVIKLYVDLMKARFKEKLNVKFDMKSSVEQAEVPSFLLQPLVENSIKYGMETADGVEITVSAKKSGEMLKITIEDNGPGIPEANQLVLERGVGLSNTVERLENLYGGNHEFSWKNKNGGGLRICIEIPFREWEDEAV